MLGPGLFGAGNWVSPNKFDFGLRVFLERMRAMSAEPLSSFSSRWNFLPQSRARRPRTTARPLLPLPDMVRLPATDGAPMALCLSRAIARE